ncbi:RNA polymerase sigma factor [Tardiphaga sp.]|uniref:RNA polymerase sigma factor n=1 Tax=Tardiphaga sp. TaxID=1926292 RepID=UPI00352B1C5F
MMSDGELAVLSQAGRSQAFAEIVRRYETAIFRLARAFIGNADDALDITQETFISAHQALSKYDDARAMRIWLSTIALNKCRDLARKRKVRRLLWITDPITEEAEAIADDQVGIEEAVASREELDRVKLLISALPVALKEPLVLRTLQGLSQAETAKILGISEKAVETRLYRARARLIEQLNA